MTTVRTGRGLGAVTLAANTSADCTFVNEFHPTGSIIARLQTDNATGAGGFIAAPTLDQPRSPLTVQATESNYKQTATTTAPGAPATATPDTAADATDTVPLLRYTLTSLPPATTHGGTWGVRVVHVHDQ